MPTILDAAKANDAFWEAEYKALSGSKAMLALIAGLLARTHTSAYLSVNMRPSVISALLKSGIYETVFEVADRQAALIKRDPSQELRRLLGKFHDKRVAFHDAFHIPTTAFYGAVNIGGLGASDYGWFCIVLKGLAVNRPKAAYLKEDSLLSYVDNAAKVDVGRVEGEVASPARLGELVCLKHVSDPAVADPAAWPVMMCNSACYVEAIVEDTLSADQVSEMRVARHRYDYLMDLAFGGFFGRRTEPERALAQDFIDVLSGASARSIPLQAIEV